MNIFGIGDHVLYDELTNEQRAMLIEHWSVTQPAWIVIKVAGDVVGGMLWLEAIRHQFPSMGIILRLWPDDGLLKEYQYSAALYWRLRILDMIPWLRYHKVVFQIENESNEFDLTAYAKTTAELLERGYEHEVRLGYFSFATGTPDDGSERRDAYQELKPVVRVVSDRPGFHVLKPNEYFGRTPQLSAGHVARYLRIWDLFSDDKRPAPLTVIGEFGLMANYHDAESGYKSIGLGPGAYAQDVINTYHDWYQKQGVAVCVFAATRGGTWEPFNTL